MPQIERRHILRNASLPMITAVGMHIGELIGGTIIENIFAWPGIGRYAVSAILTVIIRLFNVYTYHGGGIRPV